MSSPWSSDLLRALALATLCALPPVLGGCGAEQDRSQLSLSGSVDARELDLAFQVGGRIEALNVDEGDTIASGQLVAELDARDYALALEAAEAEARAANRALAALQAGTRPQELRVAEADVQRAGAELQLAADELGRVAKLVPRRLASEEQLQQKQVQHEVARTRLQQAQQTLHLLREGPRQEDVERAAAELAARESAVATARTRLGYTRLASPGDGVISVRLAEKGEVVAAGQPVLRLTELAHPWVRAYLNEQDLSRVRLGQPAEVRVDGAARTFQGRLSFISPEAEFTPKTVETRALRVDLVYRIKVDVDNADGLLKVGMPADVTLQLARTDG